MPPAEYEDRTDRQHREQSKANTGIEQDVLERCRPEQNQRSGNLTAGGNRRCTSPVQPTGDGGKLMSTGHGINHTRARQDIGAERREQGEAKSYRERIGHLWPVQSISSDLRDRRKHTDVFGLTHQATYLVGRNARA